MTEEEPQVAPEQEVAQDVAVESPDEQQDRVLMDLDGFPDDDDLTPVYDGESEPDGDERETSAGEAADDSPSPYDEPDLEAVYDVLRRDGWSDEDFERFDPDRLVELAEHRKQMQADIDRKLRGDNDTEDTTDEQTDSEGTAEPTSDLPDTAPDEDVEYLSDYLGLDEAGKNLLHKFRESSMKPVLGILEETRSQMQALQTMMVRQEVERSRDALRGEYADIVGEDANFQRVLKRMDKLAQADGEDMGVQQLMEEAILMEFKGEITDKVKTAKKSVSHLRNAGQPTVRPKAPRAETQYSSNEEREDAVLKILESDDPDRFQRARALGRK